jgi:serine protease AprX
MTEPAPAPCALCARPSDRQALAEAAWVSADVEARLLRAHPDWRRADGACPACVQQALLETLLERGEASFHDSVQRVWPLDPEAAFGALPTPLRLHADPRFTGRGVLVAVVDAAFHQHPDLVRARNRIRAWADAGGGGVEWRRFTPGEAPRWPGWDAGDPAQWHGLMTSTVLAGDGALSHGLYRGLAPAAELVLVQVRDRAGRIGNETVARALRFLLHRVVPMGLRVVNLSLGGDPVEPLLGNAVDAAVGALVRAGVCVIVAAGNDGVRRLVPPGTAPEALTVGGLDDRSLWSDDERALWHSNYGSTALGASKPELVAPSLRVVAPVLPGSELTAEAAALFARRASGDASVEARLAELKLVAPDYQHVEGTSFAAPIVAGLVACMLEANPALSPRRVRELLLRAATPVPGADAARQGAGAVDAGRAVALALGDHHGARADWLQSASFAGGHARFLLHEHEAREVHVVGSWDGWREPGTAATQIEAGLWEARVRLEGERREQHYKFRLDGERWLADPANPARVHDGHGGWNSRLLPA